MQGKGLSPGLSILLSFNLLVKKIICDYCNSQSFHVLISEWCPWILSAPVKGSLVLTGIADSD